MRPNRIALTIIAALVGLIWMGQGVGLIGGSFMTGSALWAVIGVALTMLAGAMLTLELRAGRRR
jgi:hypothetical protein